MPGLARHGLTPPKLLLTLVLIIGQVPAAAQVASTRSVPGTVVSGTFLAAAVPLASSINPLGPINLTLTAHDDYFVIKNFGTESVWRLSVTQTLSSVTLRYCVGQGFKKGDPKHCADSSAPVTLGVGLSIPDVVLTSPIAAGAALNFSAASVGPGTDVLNVLVTAGRSSGFSTVS